MAQGDVVFFDQFLVDVAEGLHDLENDVIKVALTDGTTTPAATTADPRWGAGGTTNFAAEEVTAGGNYAAGGATPTAPSVTLSAGTSQIDWGDVSWVAAGGNPTNATWAIIYNDTDAGKRAIGYVDIGGAFNMTTGDLDITWGTPVATIDQA